MLNIFHLFNFSCCHINHKKNIRISPSVFPNRTWITFWFRFIILKMCTILPSVNAKHSIGSIAIVKLSKRNNHLLIFANKIIFFRFLLLLLLLKLTYVLNRLRFNLVKDKHLCICNTVWHYYELRLLLLLTIWTYAKFRFNFNWCLSAERTDFRVCSEFTAVPCVRQVNYPSWRFCTHKKNAQLRWKSTCCLWSGAILKEIMWLMLSAA